jgi:hypothetical protein
MVKKVGVRTPDVVGSREGLGELGELVAIQAHWKVPQGVSQAHNDILLFFLINNKI